MEQQAVSPLVSFMPLILIFVVFYFLLIRPQQKRQREHELLLKSLAKNDEVVTNGGIHGTIINVKDTTVILRVDENVKLEIEKHSIAHIKKKRGEGSE